MCRASEARRSTNGRQQLSGTAATHRWRDEANEKVEQVDAKSIRHDVETGNHVHSKHV